MPTSPAEQWLPVLFQMALAMIIAAALVTLSFAIGRKVKNRVKDMPYECGISPTGDARERFSVRFYLVAMLFILFDIEAIFLFPWAVIYKDLKMFAFLEMLLFVVLILAGFFFIWKKGVLDWADGERNVNPATARLKGMLEEVPAKVSRPMIPEDLQSNPVVAALADLAVSAKFEFNELTVEIAPEKIVEAMGRVKNSLKFERITSVTGVDRYPAEPRFEVVYHLQAIAKKERLRLKSRVSGGSPEIESVTPVYRGAEWYERETFDLFGVRFLNHPNLTRIMMPDDWEGHPLAEGLPDHGVCGINDMSTITTGVTSEADVRRDAATHQDSAGHRTMVLNMGPQHPSTHGVLRLLLELDGETIVKAAPDIGYLHTGIEKEFEVKTYQQGVTLTDRIDYLAPLSNNLVYCLAAEKLLGLEIPELAQFTRVMLAEFTRLNSHLVWLATHAIDIGAMSVFLYCFREREEILRIFEMFSGQRMMTSYFRIGGLALPHPRGWQKRVKDFVDIFPSRIDEYEELLTGNRIWTGRTKGVGYISLEDMLELSVTGPMLRAAGLAIDVRKDAPYSGYEKFSFKVPTRTENDVFARYLLRIDEMRESHKIIKQALEGMPAGSHQADAPGIVLPEREKMKTQMESLIYHFKIVTEGFRVPEGEVYQAVESPRGEVGCYMVSDGTQKPYRVHWRGPSFGNLQSIPKLIEGTLIADVIAALGSMDFVLGDTDR